MERFTVRMQTPFTSLLKPQPRRSQILPFEALKNSATALVQFRASIVADTGNSYLVWIDNERLLDPLSDPVNFDSVSSMFDLEEVEKFPDGGIYLFK